MSKKTLSGVYYELNGDGYQKHKNAQISFPKASNDKESPRAFSLPVIKEHETPESHKSQTKNQRQNKQVNKMFQKQQINSIHCDDKSIGDSVHVRQNKIKKQLSKSTNQDVSPKKGILKRSLVDQKQNQRSVSPPASNNDDNNESFKLLNSLSVELSRQRKRRQSLQHQFSKYMTQQRNRQSYSQQEKEDNQYSHLDRIRTDRSSRLSREEQNYIRGSLGRIKKSKHKPKYQYQSIQGDSETVYKKNHYNSDFQEKVLQNVDLLADRIRFIEQQMVRSEERIMRSQLEKQLLQKQKIISNMEAENKRIRQLGSSERQKNSKNVEQPQNYLQQKFPFLVAFLIGILVIILFTKPERTCQNA